MSPFSSHGDGEAANTRGQIKHQNHPGLKASISIKNFNKKSGLHQLMVLPESSKNKKKLPSDVAEDQPKRFRLKKGRRVS